MHIGGVMRVRSVEDQFRMGVGAIPQQRGIGVMGGIQHRFWSLDGGGNINLREVLPNDHGNILPGVAPFQGAAGNNTIRPARCRRRGGISDEIHLHLDDSWIAGAQLDFKRSRTLERKPHDCRAGLVILKELSEVMMTALAQGE